MKDKGSFREKIGETENMQEWAKNKDKKGAEFYILVWNNHAVLSLQASVIVNL